MTPTSDERRAVAARLRESAAKRGVILDYLGSEQVNSWWLLLHSIGCEGNHQEVVFNLLADLIDPTCEMVPATRHPYGDYANCRCSACGYDGAFEPLVRPVDGYPVPDERMWRYCPHCGARVANNGE